MEEFFSEVLEHCLHSSVKEYFERKPSQDIHAWRRNIGESMRDTGFVSDLLDEIHAVNRSVHQKNQQLIDEYNRSVFSCLQNMYCSDLGLTDLSAALVILRRAKLATLEALTRPTITAPQLHMLKTLFPNAIANALHYVDGSYEDVGNISRNGEGLRISRVVRLADLRSLCNNPLLSLFPDKVRLNHVIGRLLEENLFFIYVESRSLGLPVFTFPSQTIKRHKQHASYHMANVGDVVHRTSTRYICMGGYYCHCEAFANKVLVGTHSKIPPRTKDTKSLEIPEGSFAREYHHLVSRQSQFCKHGLAAQIVLACEPRDDGKGFDAQCFFGHYSQDLTETNEYEFRIPETASFYCDWTAVSDKRYEQMFSRI